jgi:hypothetical protein
MKEHSVVQRRKLRMVTLQQLLHRLSFLILSVINLNHLCWRELLEPDCFPK